jgi:hypothetical protein
MNNKRAIKAESENNSRSTSSVRRNGDDDDSFNRGPKISLEASHYILVQLLSACQVCT